ncbi:aminoglycoside adenylyltransferase domain-containing protein [Paenibacillus soyae]|uniref:DUF4111 domain-containing protein n=1 Tax=Paenibacillus soyae TaxID=2969249 RepID=A0A9X2MXX5_9BACL|nr:aminoglycoside adenylyltransferase domain-containing protein [Paenibacillus soyae]MCR2807886.1 DUF4111 domain-containing protein [Paenibacillus soyae]
MQELHKGLIKGLHWEDGPQDVVRQALLAKQYAMDYLKEALVGVYVHGSLCLGAFHEGRSDLDLLMVVNRPLTVQERFQLMVAFLGFHRTPAPIEVSIMLQDDLLEWKHPAPYQFHFSDYWRKRYADMAYWDDASFWDYEGERTDIDLACHVSLAKQFGVTLHGPAAGELFPAVPEADFWESIRSGAESLMTAAEGDACLTVQEDEAQGILTLARIWSYQEHGIFFTKTEAAEWAAKRLPEKLSKILLASIEVYGGSRSGFHCPPESWNELRATMLTSCPLSLTRSA